MLIPIKVFEASLVQQPANPNSVAFINYPISPGCPPTPLSFTIPGSGLFAQQFFLAWLMNKALDLSVITDSIPGLIVLLLASTFRDEKVDGEHAATRNVAFLFDFH